MRVPIGSSYGLGCATLDVSTIQEETAHVRRNGSNRFDF